MSAGFLMYVCKWSHQRNANRETCTNNLLSEDAAPVANMDEHVLTSGYSSFVAPVGANLHLVEVNGENAAWKCLKRKKNQVEGATKSWLKREECDLIRRLIAAAHAVDTGGWNVPAALFHSVPENGITLVWSGKDHTNLQVLLQTPTLVC